MPVPPCARVVSHSRLARGGGSHSILVSLIRCLSSVEVSDSVDRAWAMGTVLRGPWIWMLGAMAINDRILQNIGLYPLLPFARRSILLPAGVPLTRGVRLIHTAAHLGSRQLDLQAISTSTSSPQHEIRRDHETAVTGSIPRQKRCDLARLEARGRARRARHVGSDAARLLQRGGG